MSQTARADALHAEWTKLRTLASTGWLLLGVVALTVAVSAAADAAASCPAGGCQADPAKLSLTGIQVGQAIVAVIAVLAVSNEYSTGMIRVTLAAMPRRLTVLAAKAALVVGLVLAAGAVAVLASRAGRAADPARARLHPRARVPGRCRWARGGAAGRLRVGPVPRADRAAQPRRGDRRAGVGGGHRRSSSACCTCSRS